MLPIKIGHLKFAETGTMDLLAEFVMFFMTLVYSGRAVYNISREGPKAYCRSGWNVMEIINFILFWTAFGFRYAAVFNGAEIKFPPQDTDFIYMSSVATQILNYKYVMGFCSILTFARVFKLLGHIPFMARLVNILSACAEDVLSFLCCSMVVFCGYMGAFHLTYGNHLKEWATYGESLMSLYRITHGEWDYDGMVEYQPTIGPFYFVTFSLLAICLLMNMFVALIMEAYVLERLLVVQVSSLAVSDA